MKRVYYIIVSVFLLIIMILCFWGYINRSNDNNAEGGINIKENNIADIRFYTLDNEIPGGIVLQHLDMDEVISMIGQPDEYSEWENVIDNEELPAIIYYLDASEYGYDNLSMKMKFSKEGNLEEIYVYSQLVLGVVSFDDNDIKRVAKQIQECLQVEPEISHFEGTQYTFIKDGLRYRMDTHKSQHRVNNSYEEQNQFNLTVSCD